MKNVRHLHANNSGRTKTPRAVMLSVFLLCTAGNAAFCENVSLYYDQTVPQISFAAGDIKTALAKRSYTIVDKSITELNASVSGKKIVIARKSDAAAVALLGAQGGANIANPGEQSYAMRTTNAPAKSFWVIGGDANGAMYGGLQIAENINFSALDGVYNEDEQPHLKLRGIKFNIPWDERSQTYFNNFEGTAHQEAVRLVWDKKFWETWFDEMARHRYNALSLWSNHPFTSLIDTPGYPKMALTGVVGFESGTYDKEVQINTMTIAEKTKFWQEVMLYGHNRGFSIYLMTWNIFLRGQLNKADMLKEYGLTEDMWNAKTKTYLQVATRTLLEKFPHLSGFGVTVGENMGDLNPGGDEASDKDKSQWVYDAYGLGMKAYSEKPENQSRPLTFIHRSWMGDLKDIKDVFQPLQNLPNVVVDVSYKYAIGHAHAAPKPGYWEQHDMSTKCQQNGFKSWLTIRNDDFYFLHWSDPGFVKEFISNYPKEYVDATYIGSDGWTFTNNFNSKDAYYHGPGAVKPYAIQKTWMMQKLWGRIGYNPKTADSSLFKDHIAYAYNLTPGKATYLYDAWSMASRANCRVGEQVTGDWNIDQDYWPEAWTDHEDDQDRFLTLALMPDGKPSGKFAPPPGSLYATLFDTAQGNDLDGKISALENVTQIEQLAKNALGQLATFKAIHVLGSSNDQRELGLLLRDIEALSYLAHYGANKFRARMALWKKGLSVDAMKAEARDHMGRAYAYWKKYTAIMDTHYTGANMQRNARLPSWTANDAKALKEFSDLGGPAGTGALVTFASPNDLSIIPQAGTTTVTVNHSITGRTVTKVELFRNGASAAVDTSAPYQFSLSGLTAGPQFLEARVSDSSGATSFAVMTVVATTASVTPPKPNVDDATSATPTLSGTTTANALITIYRNGVKLPGGSVTANSAGSWSFTVSPALAVGNHVFTVTSTAPSAAESAQSAGVTVIVSSGGGGGGGSGGGSSATPTSAPTVDSATSSTPTLSGTAPAGALITIYDGTVKIGETIASSSGNWSFTVSPPLTSGSHNLSYTVTETGKTESGHSPISTITIASGGAGGGPAAGSSSSSSSCGLGSNMAGLAMLGFLLCWPTRNAGPRKSARRMHHRQR